MDSCKARDGAARECAERMRGKRLGGAGLVELKKKASEHHGLDGVVRNSDVAAALREAGADGEASLLRTRATRSLSGVCVVAVMARPWPCPHGKCVYCPGGPQKDSPGSPQSYTGKEPAALRAAQNNFDSFLQVSNRLAQLEAIGHEPSKCELIVMGGTFNSQPRDYQRDFVKRAFDGFNGAESKDLAGAFALNESAAHRVVGVTFETRPDLAAEKEVRWLVGLGATRVELGVQTLSDEVYERVGRGHGVKEVVGGTRACKDAFLKVCYHWMPGLFVSPDEDVELFARLFSDERFRPDMLKIYPTLVMPGTGLHDLWKKGEFEPYDDATAAGVVARMKRIVPEYVRIMRVDRDIPTPLIAAGVKKSNLRQLARAEMERRGWKCGCIRCREAGFKKNVDWGAVELKRTDYGASGGREVFLSFVDGVNDALVGFLRLRRNENGSVGVRELRVFGRQVPVGGRREDAAQHRGLGKKLLAAAEEIALSEFGARELLVLPGAGVKPYYRGLGYCDEGMYLAKKLK
ncbi:MAG: tRNA uridine(34) 5-carboxymethylaminomethyl modification radical SAM/GNAT enzyme Elp3 [Candidatus Micrarchaeota archaeon]|nr:tRNA uridine(34) 5-carboxymethylaminomethyl modification radical SAM/GNAT enzyme Elp3 [Candidatus Micrarchaeota archaeon]